MPTTVNTLSESAITISQCETKFDNCYKDFKELLVKLYYGSKEKKYEEILNEKIKEPFWVKTRWLRWLRWIPGISRSIKKLEIQNYVIGCANAIEEKQIRPLGLKEKINVLKNEIDNTWNFLIKSIDINILLQVGDLFRQAESLLKNYEEASELEKQNQSLKELQSVTDSENNVTRNPEAKQVERPDSAGLTVIKSGQKSNRTSDLSRELKVTTNEDMVAEEKYLLSFIRESCEQFLKENPGSTNNIVGRIRNVLNESQPHSEIFKENEGNVLRRVQSILDDEIPIADPLLQHELAFCKRLERKINNALLPSNTHSNEIKAVMAALTVIDKYLRTKKPNTLISGMWQRWQSRTFDMKKNIYSVLQKRLLYPNFGFNIMGLKKDINGDIENMEQKTPPRKIFGIKINSQPRSRKFQKKVGELFDALDKFSEVSSLKNCNDLCLQMATLFEQQNKDVGIKVQSDRGSTLVRTN